jgi:phosphatidylserine/phosphatidylglycerophosphate/cardiolipin synthase-like enzyme
MGVDQYLQRGTSGARSSRRSTVVLAILGLLLALGLAGCGSSNSAAKPAVTYSLVQEPQQGYGSVYSFIDSAKSSIDVTMYAFADPNAQAALLGAAHRGVDVRVMFDSDSNGQQIDQAAYAALKAGGVHVEWAFPGVLWHQKSIMVDSKRVMIMTANLDAQYYPIIRGFLVTTDNPATVSGIVSTFNTDFTHTTSAPQRGVIPAGSELIWAPGAQNPLVSLIGTAKPGTTLITENEQFTSPVIAQALVAAAKRGVTVDVVLTYNASYAPTFNTLVAGGVRVRTYAANAPLYIQSKAMTVNNSTLYVGSVNFVQSSMNADRNVGLVTTNSVLVHDIQATMMQDFAGATPYTPAP